MADTEGVMPPQTPGEFDPEVARLLVDQAQAAKAQKAAAEADYKEKARTAADYLQRNGGRVTWPDPNEPNVMWEAVRRASAQTTWRNVDAYAALGSTYPHLFRQTVDTQAVEKEAKTNPSVLTQFAPHCTISEKAPWVEVKMVKAVEVEIR